MPPRGLLRVRPLLLLRALAARADAREGLRPVRGGGAHADAEIPGDLFEREVEVVARDDELALTRRELTQHLERLDPLEPRLGVCGRCGAEQRLKTRAPARPTKLAHADRVQPGVGAFDPLDNTGLEGREHRVLQGVLRALPLAGDRDQATQHPCVDLPDFAIPSLTLQRASLSSAGGEANCLGRAASA